jgi:signal transduction histidine kinase
MATDDNTNTPRTPQMRPDEMRGLASRLRARADSVLMRDQPEQQRDMRQAAALIEQLAALTAEILTSAAVIDGLTRLLEIAGGA